MESNKSSKIVYASRIPPRPIGGQRLGNSLFCGREILQNRSRGSSKINPGGSQGHQKSFLGALRARSWAVRAQLGTLFDIWRAILTLSGLILELPAFILMARGTVLGAPGFISWVPGHPVAAFCRFCSNFAEYMKTIEKPWFSYGFFMISTVWG